MSSVEFLVLGNSCHLSQDTLSLLDSGYEAHKLSKDDDVDHQYASA